MATTAKARQSEQGALKQGGIDLLVMPPKLKGRLPLWRVCSVGRSAVRQNGGTNELAHLGFADHDVEDLDVGIFHTHTAHIAHAGDRLLDGILDQALAGAEATTLHGHIVT